MRRQDTAKILLGCFSGSVLEWFDFAVYGYLTPIIASQFFPSSNKLASILLTYGVFAIGFLFRPLGAIFFGYIGDRFGRRTALVISSLLMAIPTFIIGALPNYAAIGLLAPLFLIFCRILQGISIGGEFTGSFIYLVEQGTVGRKGFYSCFADLGCSSGMILGSLCVALLNSFLTADQLSSFGWRLPFLSGILLALVAFYIRTSLTESLEFSKAEKPVSLPLADIFSKFPKELIYSTLVMSINSLGFYLLVVFIPNQTVLMGKVSAEHAYLVNTVILTVLMIATFSSACACDYFDKAKIYFIGTISCLLLAYPTFYALMNFSLLGQIVVTSLLAIGIGFCFGPRPLFLMGIFPPLLRYSAIALALNIANGILGGTAPLLATFLIAKTGSIESVAILIIIASAVSLYSILSLGKLTFSLKVPRGYLIRMD